MDKRRTDRGLKDRGVTSVQFLLAAALGLLLFLMLANLVVVQYGRGAVRSALDQGARAGALSGASSECADKASAVLGQLLGGRMSDSVTLGCVVVDGSMQARATGIFEGWTFASPDFPFDLVTEATLEVVP
ncbi:MAG: hypothetical protein U9N56_05900 [Actinomycetota bacterium]|nr:hypothetical protein [Actinomycetota bacterium]